MSMPMQIEAYAEPDRLDDTVLTKYTTAALFANQALDKVLEQCQPGVNTAKLCAFGDNYLKEATETVYKTGIERGIAEPTTVNVNNGYAGYSPVDGNPYILQLNDVVKVSLGAHIDGYTAKVCHTIIICPPGQSSRPNAEPRVANAMIAAHYAAEAVTRMFARISPLEAPVTGKIIRSLVDEAANSFGVRVVEGSRIRSIKRYLIGQARVEEDAMGADRPKQVQWLRQVHGAPVTEDEDFVVERGEAWLIDIAMSTGTGQVREDPRYRPTIFARDVTVTYNMKLKAAQATLREIEQTKSVYPFCIRSLSDQRTAPMGITECKNKGVVASYPVLAEQEREIIARQACTLLVQKSGSQDLIRLTNHRMEQSLHSDYEIVPGDGLDLLINSYHAKIKDIGTGGGR